ncbi:MAG TPA: [protein-PII] uridylyltransferase [Acidimicrobiales bacterium]|nr:[protein-PII] uridylyltransferase [Acidimicrobiales bacterium]
MSLRERRQALIARADLQGDAFCRAYSAAADEWLSDLFATAAGGNEKCLGLVGVGGYGRGELCPFSDLDVVLVHRGRKDVSGIADRIWYPVWDEGVHLDHSVRKPNEVLRVAAADLRVALGLLDARVICGDAHVAEPMIATARDRWAQQKPPWLEELSERVQGRHTAYGDVAFLLEPDLKEAHGGLRDAAALRALVLAVPELAHHVDLGAVAAAQSALTRVRVELQRRSAREMNRLLLQEQDQVAEALGETDADSLMLTVAEAGRTIAWESDDAWRRQRQWAKYTTYGRGRRQRGSRGEATETTPTPTHDAGVGVLDGEIVLLPDADLGDPALPVHVAAVAAERNLPIARETLHVLNREAPAPPVPWPDDLRETLVRVLATGRPAIAALEALDQRDLFARFLPEWLAVRNKPQRNAYHRFTVDRHLLEATANAATLAHRVGRPDLLLIATLLHDIGKGFTGDHTQVGIEVVAEIAERMGFGPDDVGVLVSLVRLHLLLPEMATRRDLDDPATAERVAKEVGDRLTLDLLAALVEADSQATGPSAWGSWKAGLVSDLVARTKRLLDGEQSAPPTTWVTEEHRRTMETVRISRSPVLTIDDHILTVVAPDRPGLFAQVTGILALHGLDVRTANVAGEDGVAVDIFTVEPSRGRWPQASRLTDELVAAVNGTLTLTDRLAERTRAYRREKRPVAPQHVATEIAVDNAASASATVIEVRAEDVVGQLHRITQALFDCDLDVISAKVNTFGAAVVDAFYVRGPDGEKVTDPHLLDAVDRAVRDGVAEQAKL